MAALGAAAGAFEGDNAREEQRARRAGLGLQAASLAQQDRQFVDRKTLEREQMALEREQMAAAEAENSQRRSDKIDELSMHQFNADRRMKFDEKKVAIDQENELYQRGRNEQQDAWKSALDEQDLLNKRQEFESHNLEYAELQRIRKQGEEARANKTRLAESNLGYVVRSAIENGAASPEELAIVSKKVGIPIEQAYPMGDGSVMMRINKGIDKQSGQPIYEDRLVDPTIVKSVMERFVDPMSKDAVDVPTTSSILTKRQEQEAQNAFNLKRDEARYNSQLERDTLKAGNIVDPLKKARYMGLQREQAIALKDLLGRTEEDDPEDYKKRQDYLDGIEAKMVALESGSVAPIEKEKPGSKRGFVKGGGSGEVVERTLKNGQKALVRQLSNGKWEVVGGVDGPRVTSSNGEVKSNFGPEPGTTEYWRDMPRGQATGMSKREIGFARRDILKRLESAHRKGPKSRDEAAKIKAELDAFNDKYPV